MEITSIPRRQRVSPEERNRIVQLFHDSGLTQHEFAQQHGLKLGTFRQWLYRQRPKKKNSTPFQELPVSALVAPCWCAEIVLDSGLTFRLNCAASAEWIASVLPVLGQKPC